MFYMEEQDKEFAEMMQRLKKFYEIENVENFDYNFCYEKTVCEQISTFDKFLKKTLINQNEIDLEKMLFLEAVIMNSKIDEPTKDIIFELIEESKKYIMTINNIIAVSEPEARKRIQSEIKFLNRWRLDEIKDKG